MKTEDRLESLERDMWKIHNPERFNDGDEVIIYFRCKLKKVKYDHREIIRDDGEYPGYHCKYGVIIIDQDYEDGWYLYKTKNDMIFSPDELKDVLKNES